MPWRTGIVGRRQEIAEPDSQWQRAAAREFCFVLVVGEPGMGKTRLAAEAEARGGPTGRRPSARRPR